MMEIGAHVDDGVHPWVSWFCWGDVYYQGVCHVLSMLGLWGPLPLSPGVPYVALLVGMPGGPPLLVVVLDLVRTKHGGCSVGRFACAGS